MEQITQFILSAGSHLAIQAVEVGNRPTDWEGYTGNGQMQWVPIGNGMMRLDVVPSAAGGWVDTGFRRPMFTEGVLHTFTQRYAYANQMFWPLEVKVDDDPPEAIPPGLVNPTMTKLNWQAGETVVCLQPDDNTSGLEQDWEVIDVSMKFL